MGVSGHLPMATSIINYNQMIILSYLLIEESEKSGIIIIVPSLTAKKRRELINKGFLRFLNCPKRSYILLLFLGFPYYSFHADIRQDLIIRSKTCHLMKPVGKVCPGIGRQISLLFTRPVHVH